MPQLLTLVANSTTSAPALFFFAIPLLAGIMFLCAQLLLHYIYDVRLGATAVEIVMFKWLVVFSIPYEDLAGVQRVSFVEAIFSFGLGFVNRPFGKFFILHRSRGLSRRILVTPSDSDTFYNKLMERMG